MSDMDFDSHHLETVKKFINGVYYIEDNVSFCEEVGKPSTLNTPDELGGGTTQSSNETAAGARPKLVQAQKVIEPFAKKGIHCYIHEYKDDFDGLHPLNTKSDVIIFDWKLKNINAMSILSDTLNSTVNSFRYAAIYTSEKHHQIVTDICKNDSLKGSFTITNERSDIIDFKVKGEGYVLARVQLFTKQDGSELCDLVLDGYSQFSRGLLRNSMLQAILSIRENIPKLLSLYPKEIDKGAVSHLTMLRTSEKGFSTAEINFRDYISSLFSDNFSDVLLYSQGIKKSLSLTSIQSFFKDGLLVYRRKKKTEVDKPADVWGELVDPSASFATLNSKGGGKDLVIETDDEPLKIMAYNCSSMKRDLFSKNNYPLKFGTIVLDKENSQYLLCLQPLCDGIRLSEKISFPFMELSASENGEKFDFVVKVKGSYICLKRREKPQNIKMYCFAPKEGEDDIRTNSDGCFDGASDVSLTWVGELKNNYVQEAAQSIYLSGVRIGMDKFEWIRVNQS